MLAGTRGLDRRIQRQQVGLVGDVVDDADLVRDLLHRRDCGAHRFAALDRLARGLAGHAVGDLGVLGVLRDRGGHLLQRGAGLLYAGGLLAGRLAQRLRGGADFFRRAGQRLGIDVDLADHLRQARHGGVDAVAQFLQLALAVDVGGAGQVAFLDRLEHLPRLVEWADHRVQGLVDAVDDAAEIAVVQAGIGAHVQAPGRGGVDQQVGVADQCAQVAADLLDGVIDERLLAWQLRQRRVEIAATEFGDHAHCQLLDRDVTHDHAVDAVGHAAEIAFEALAVDGHVDVAGVVFGRHVVHLRDQPQQVAAHLFDGVVDERLLAGEALQRRLEIAAAEFGDAGYGLLLDRDVAADHAVDALGDGAEIAFEALTIDDHVDVAGIVLARHARDLVADLAHAGLHLAQRQQDFAGLVVAQRRHHHLEIAAGEAAQGGGGDPQRARDRVRHISEHRPAQHRRGDGQRQHLAWRQRQREAGRTGCQRQQHGDAAASP